MLLRVPGKAKIEAYEKPKIDRIRDILEQDRNDVPNELAYRYTENKEQRDVTFGRFYEDVYSLGTAVAQLGFGSAHIGCVGQNSYNWILTYVSTIAGDGVFVGMDKELVLADMLNVVNQGESDILFCSEKYEKIFAEHRAEIPRVKKIVCFEREEDEGDFLSFNKLLESGRKAYVGGAKDYVDMKGDREALRMIIFTSGTTGIAKGVMLSEKNLVSCVYYALRMTVLYDRCLSVLPYHHSYEGVCGILIALYNKATLCINENLRTISANLKKYKPTYILLVPALADALYKSTWKNIEKQGKGNLVRRMIKISNGLRKVGIDIRRKLFKSILEGYGGELKELVSGGAPITPEVGEFFDAIGLLILNGYGITECSPLVSVNRPDYNDCHTVGFPIDCLEVRIENPDEEGNGDICVKGDSVMLGYYNNPEATAEAIVDGWFNTGDFGHINELGQIVITGRKKNIIVRKNGKNIYPEEIESHINPIPYVVESVVSQEVDGDEEILVAEVFLDAEEVEKRGFTDPAANLKADIDAALAELPTYKQITKIYLRDHEFEKNSSKKIKRSNFGK